MAEGVDFLFIKKLYTRQFHKSFSRNQLHGQNYRSTFCYSFKFCKKFFRCKESEKFITIFIQELAGIKIEHGELEDDTPVLKEDWLMLEPSGKYLMLKEKKMPNGEMKNIQQDAIRALIDTLSIQAEHFK